mgnify:CR=1 FL=1
MFLCSLKLTDYTQSMTFFYHIFLALFYFGTCVASLFDEKIRKFLIGRKGIFGTLKKADLKNKNVIWFHAASLGEFEQGRPVIEEIKRRDKNVTILLTFFSPSGYEIRKNYAGADVVVYLPFDFTWMARKFVRLANPKAVFFIKYEFWHNYLNQLHQKNIPTYCFSSIFRPQQVFFKWYGGWYRSMLKYFNHIFVQNQQSKELLASIGITNTSICSDTRFDRVYELASQAKQLPVIEKFINGHKAFIAGSSWPADEKLIIQYFNAYPNPVKLIFAPHEIKEDGINSIVSSINKKVIRYSQAEKVNLSEYDVLIIDNVGMLSSVYRYGYAAYIGGGFGKGIHNILEAATFGIPVVFGPNYKKFREAVELAEKGGAFPIANINELTKILDKIHTDKVFLEKAGTISRDYVADGRGATGLILDKTGF